MSSARHTASTPVLPATPTPEPPKPANDFAPLERGPRYGLCEPTLPAGLSGSPPRSLAETSVYWKGAASAACQEAGRRTAP